MAWRSAPTSMGGEHPRTPQMRGGAQLHVPHAPFPPGIRLLFYPCFFSLKIEKGKQELINYQSFLIDFAEKST